MDQAMLEDVNGAYDKLTADELGNLAVVLGAYRSFRGMRRDHLAYVSMPITSGKRYYEVLAAHGVKDTAELAAKVGKDALYQEIIRPNIEQGIAFADQLGLQNKDRIFIAPSVFEAKRWRWTQDAYMSLWYRVLGEMAGQHYLMDGWEYSTGGVKEVMFSVFMQNFRLGELESGEFWIKDFLSDIAPDQRLKQLLEMAAISIRQSDGSHIDVIGAIEKIADAATDLKNKGFPYQDLVMPARRMYGAAMDADGRMPFAWYDRLSAAVGRLPAIETPQV